MIVAFTPSTQISENLHLEINISTTLGITAEDARRKVTRFLMDQVSFLISPQVPLLIIAGKEAIFWRFPLVLSMAHRGKLGQVGEVDVDALSGKLLINDELIEEIKRNAHRLTASATHPTNN